MFFSRSSLALYLHSQNSDGLVSGKHLSVLELWSCGWQTGARCSSQPGLGPISLPFPPDSTDTTSFIY